MKKRRREELPQHKGRESDNTIEASGPDSVSLFLLKHCEEAIVRSLVRISYQCLHTKTGSRLWKETRATHVHKIKEQT